MTKSPWSAHYPDRWLPNDGTGKFEGKPDPRWREHKPGDPLPCPEDMRVEGITVAEREDQTWVALGTEAWICHNIVAWRPADPGVWYLDKGDAKNDYSVAALKVAINGYHQLLFSAFRWANTPQGADYWAERSAGFKSLSPDDITFMRALLAAYEQEPVDLPEPVEAPATSRQIGGDHYSKLAIQPIEYIEANRLGFSEGCVVKYVTRWRDKGGVADLKKAAHVLQMMIEREKGKA